MPMQPIVFKVALFRGDWDQARSQHAMLWMLEALCRINCGHLRQGRGLAARGKLPAPYPALYRAGVHYEPEPGTEEWLDIPNILDVRGGVYPGPWCDCEDLACWRVAEYRELPWHWQLSGTKTVADPRFLPPGFNPKKWQRIKGGVAAKPFAKWRRKPDGAYGYHALVLMPDGKIEDPSLVLGMRQEAAFAKAGMAEKFKRGIANPVIQYAAKPDVVVVDPEKPGGFGTSPEAAARRVGLTHAAGEDLAAWGYDRRDVRAHDMMNLREIY
jgi:hypothetical protein